MRCPSEELLIGVETQERYVWQPAYESGDLFPFDLVYEMNLGRLIFSDVEFDPVERFRYTLSELLVVFVRATLDPEDMGARAVQMDA